MSVNGVGEPDEAELAARRRQLVILAAALVLAMSTWFSTAAVLSQLKAAWQLSPSAGSWLTIMVQLGFVAGAALSAATNLADRVPPRRLIRRRREGADGNAREGVLQAFQSFIFRPERRAPL